MTKSGLYIPEQAKEKPNRGIIIGVGPGRTTDHGVLIPSQVKIGDRVLFGKFAGSMVVIDDEEIWILKESDLFAQLVSDSSDEVQS